MFWATSLMKLVERRPGEPANVYMFRLARDPSADQKLQATTDAIAWLRRDFGRWQVPWGEINRFQRISAAITDPKFSDSAASIPVPFADGYFGSLASIRSKPKPGQGQRGSPAARAVTAASRIYKEDRGRRGSQRDY